MVKVLPSQSCGLKLLVLGLLREHAHLVADHAQRLGIRESNDGNQQAFLHGHGHTDVHMAVVADTVAQPAAVHLGMLLQGNGHGLDHQIVEADLVGLRCCALIASRT